MTDRNGASRAKKRKQAPIAHDRNLPHFDVWVCEGRLCTSHGADKLRADVDDALVTLDAPHRARVLRGGCFGLCDFAPNIVIRRAEPNEELPSVDDDRLSLTTLENESVYSMVARADVETILRAHVVEDAPLASLVHRHANDVVKDVVAGSCSVAERIRSLRARRVAKNAAKNAPKNTAKNTPMGDAKCDPTSGPSSK